AGSLNITANSVGGDGTANAALDIDIASGANVVNVTANTGGIYLRDVGAGNVALTNFNLTATGSGQNVSITAASGSILANSAAFDTNIGDDNIYLTTENVGSAKNIVFSALLDVSVDSGNVYLTSTGDVRDSGALTLLKANYLEIDATNGVGSSGTGTGSPFNVDVTSLKATSENAIYIREDDGVDVMGLETTANTAEIQLVAGGSIVLNGDVDADNSGDVTLDAITGAITRTSGTIYGGLLTISAADGIGATGATGLAIHTDVATLVADNSNTGDIVILEANNLTVGGSTAAQTVTNNSGDIIITSASGSLNVVQDVTAGSGGDGGVVLTTATNAQTVTIGTGVTVEGGAGGIGGVTIHSDDITLNTGVTLIANGGTGYDKGGDVKLYPTNSNLAITLNGAGNVNFVTTPALTNLADFITVNDDGFLVIGDEAHSGNVTVAGTAAATFGSGTNVAVLTNKTVNLNLGASGDISTTGDVYIYAGQQIVDGGNDGSADILADNVYLNAGSGIGTAANANAAIDIVATDIYATNSTSNGVFLNILGATGAAGTGAVNVQEAHANANTAGQVWIQSTAVGGLTLTDVDTVNGAITVDQNTGAVTIVAVDGNTVAGANTVSIEGQGDVSLAGTANSHVYSAGNVDITSVQGNIVSGANTGVEVQGTNATLTAFASIGALNNEIRTQVADLDASAGVGDVRVVEADGLNLSDVDTQTGGIFITSDLGNISIDDVQSDVNLAGSADINIVATSGSVIFNAGGTLVGDDYVFIRAGVNIVSDGATGVNNEITAPRLALDVRGNIGGSGVNVLEVDADNLELLIRNDINGGSSNSAYIVDFDDLTLGGVIGGIMTGVVATAVGDVTIDISAAGSLAVVNDVNGVKADATSGDATINLTAGTDLSAADTILATTTGTGSFDASVTLTAGDNLTTTAAGTVTADVNGGSNSGNAAVTIVGNGTGVDRVVVGGNVTADAALGNAIIDISARGNGAGGSGTAALRVAGDLSAATLGMANAGVQIGVTTAGGSAYIDGAIDVSSLGVNGTDSVLIQTTQGDINLLGDITGSSTTTGSVTLNTQGGGAADINLSGAISLTGSGTGSFVEVLAGQNVGFTGSADIDLNGGASSYVRVDAAAGAITMANGARINAGSSGSIDLNANGNITIGQLITGLGGATVVTIDSTTGGVIDGGGSGGDDIIANEVGAITEINAATSIGATGGGEIETQIDTLYASGSVVAIIETDDIILGDTQAVAVPGAGIIRADGGTGTVVDITAQGDIYAYNIDATGGAGNADIFLTSNTGDVTVGAITAGLAGGDVNITANQNIFDDGDGGAFATYTEIDAGGSVNLTATNGHIGWTSSLDIFNTPANIWKAVDIDSGPVLNLNSSGNIQIFNDGSIGSLKTVPNGGQSGYEILIGAWGDITVGSALDTLQDNLALVALNGGNITLNAAAGASTGNVELYAEGDIVDGNGTAAADVFAGNGATGGSIILTAGGAGGNGAIGSAGAGGAIDLDGDVVNAKSDGSGGIYLNDVVNTNGLEVSADAQGSGNISITGSVEDMTLVDVKTFDGNITVNATGAGNDVIITSVQSDYDTGTVGANDIAIQAASGSIKFGASGSLVSDDDATLKAGGGSIVSTTANAAVEITADYLHMEAQDSIGGSAPNAVLMTDVNTLTAHFGSDNATGDNVAAGLYLDNSGALEIGGTAGTGVHVGAALNVFQANATVEITADSLTLTELVDATTLGAYNASVTLTVDGGATGDLTVGSHVLASGGGSSTIILDASAGNDVIINGEAGVKAVGVIGSVDIDAAGDVTASGGTALGAIQVTSTAGIATLDIAADGDVTVGSGAATSDIAVSATGGNALVNVAAGANAGEGSVNIDGKFVVNSTADVSIVVTADDDVAPGTGSFGNVNVSGALSGTAGGGAGDTASITITADGDVDVDGGSIKATAGTTGAIATGAIVTVNAVDVTVGTGGTIAAAGGAGFKDIVDINAAGVVTVDGGGSINAASKTGSVTINAASVVVGSTGVGNVAATGSVNAFVSIATTGAAGITVGSSGSVTADATGPGAVLSKIVLNAGTDAAADVTIDGKVQAGDALTGTGAATVDIDAADAVFMGSSGRILAYAGGANLGSIDIDANGNVDLFGTVTARSTSGNAYVNVDSVTGNIAAGSSGVGITADAGSGAGDMADINLNAVAGTVTVDGALAATGTTAYVDIDANTSVTITNSGSIYADGGAKGSVDINAGTTVSISDTIKADGSNTADIDIIAGGDVTLNDLGSGLMTTGSVATITIDTTGNVSLNEDVDANGAGFGSISVTADGATGITILAGPENGITAGAFGTANVILNATAGAVTISDTVSATAAVAVIDIDAGTNVTLNDSGNGLRANGSAVGSINVNAGGNVSLNEDVFADGSNADVYVRADGAAGITLGTGAETGVGATGAVSQVWLDTATGAGTGGAISINKAVYASGAVALVDIDSDAGVTMGAAASIISNAGGGTGTIDIDAKGTVALDNVVAATGGGPAYVYVDSTSGNITLGTNGTGISATAGGGAPAKIELDANGSVDLDNSVQASGGSVSYIDIDAGTTVTVGSSGSLAVTSASVGSIDILAQGDVTLNNDVDVTAVNPATITVKSTAGNISIGSNGSGVSATSTANTPTDISLEAVLGSVDINNDVVATGGSTVIDIDAGTTVSMGSTASLQVIATGAPGSIDIDAVGDVSLDNVVLSKSNTAPAYVKVDSTGGDISLGSNGAGISAGSVGSIGPVGGVVLNAGGDVTLDNDVRAYGSLASVDIDAAGTGGISLGTGDQILGSGTGNGATVTLDTSDGASTINIDGTVKAVSGGNVGRTWITSAGGADIDGKLYATGVNTASVIVSASGSVNIDAAVSATDANGDATITVDAGQSVTLDTTGNLTAQAGTTGTARVNILAGAGVTVNTQITADAATSTGVNAYVNIGTGGARITGAISLQSNADIYADGGTGLAAVNIFSTGNITAHGAVDIQADSDTKNGTDATVAINSSLGGVSIGAGVGSILADGDNNATVVITGGGAGANRVLVSQNVTADAASGNATLTVSAAGTGGRATDDALVVSGALSALADEGDAMVTLTSQGDATVQAAIVATGKDSVAGGDGARSADIIITVAKGLETTAGGTLTATAAEETGGSNFGPARVTITANGATNADQVRIGGAIDAVSERGQSLIDISSQGVGYVGNGVPAMYITGDLTTESKAGAGWSRIILDSQGAAGSVVITGDLSGDSAGSTGYIDLTSNAGTFQIDGSITGSFAATGIVSIDTQGGATTDIDLNNAISLTAGNFANSYVELLAGRTVDMNNTAADITAVGAGEVAITADTQAGDNGGQIIMANGTVVNAGAGIIDLDADGNITLGQLITTNNTASAVNIYSVHGALADVGDAGGEDIIATGAAAVVTITTEDGIGASGNPIETDITTLIASVTGTGGIYIDENDGITLTNVDTVKGDIVITAGNTAAGNVTATDVAVTTSGDISITNNLTGDILVGVIQTADGDIDLTANSGAINEIGAGDVGVDIITANGLLDMWASGGIGTAAGGLETTINTLYATGSSVIINETDDIILGDEQDVAIAGSGKVMATNGTGSIDIEAGGDIFANYVVAATGTATTVSIDSNGGSITLGAVSGYDVTINANKNVLDDGDGGSAAAPSVIPFYTQVVAGHDLTINAGSAGSGYYIGTNTPIDPRTGSIFLAVDAKWANVGSFNSTDNIQIYQTGDVTIAAPPNFNSGGGPDDQILHMAEDNYTVNAGFVVGGSDNIWLAALNGDLTIAAGQTVQASSGSVDLFARNGDVILAGAIAATGNAQVEATGRILDRGAGAGTGDATADITVTSGSVTLKAGSGIGTGSNTAAAIDITACDIWAANGVQSTSGAGGVFLNVINGGTPVEIHEGYAWNAGNVWIQSDSDLTLTDVQAEGVLGDVTALINGGTGSILATSVKAGDNVDITAGSLAGNIYVDYIEAGGDVDLAAIAGSILEAGAGDGSVDIVAANGTLTATAAGSIGTASEAIETTIATLVGSSTTSGDIVIDESNGIVLQNVVDADGDIIIRAGLAGTGVATLAAQTVTASGGGSAGSGNVVLTNASGNITLQTVTAHDRVTLTASTSIDDADAVDYNDVTAPELVMTAGTTIGSGANSFLDVNINNLEAYAGDTGVAGPTAVRVDNVGALTIGDITLGMSGVQAISTNNTGAATADATINILAHDLTVNEAVKAQGTDANINLSVSTGSISTSANGDISAIGGATAYVKLNATKGIDTLGTITGSATTDVDVQLLAHGTGNLDVGAAVTADAGAAGDSYMKLSTQTGSIVTQAAGTLTGSGDHARIHIDSGTGVGGPVVGDITINGAIDLNAGSSGSVNLRARLTGDIDIEAPITADATAGGVGVYATAVQGSVLTNAAISAAGTSNAVVDLQGQTTLTVNQAISAIGTNGFSTVDLTAVTGNLTTGVNGDITASGGTTVTVGLTAGGNIQTNGSIDADAGTGLADLSMTAAGSIDVNDAIAVTSTSGSVDIDLDANGGPIDTAVGASITGTATGATATTVDITLDASTSVTNNGSIDANAKTDATVELIAGSFIAVNDNIDAKGSNGAAIVDLNANGGNIATALAGSINATGGTTVDITLDATGNINNAG
ncbi:S-layer family protein, partial [Desulfatibacillum aliphaticivorans]|uniref:beta strand repeat-containing protein n=1 Tax=Desulfatibacillum aliphaticivorans TaxID=218208 RepID=UPI00048751FB